MAEKVFYVTQEGLDALEKELNDLKVNGRREVADKIKVALSYGDLSENSEYDEAKNDQAILEARIADLEVTLKNVVIVEEGAKTKKAATVKLGSKVTVLDVELDYEETYEIVSSIEADPIDNKISDDSPLGAALIGKKDGSTVSVDAPVGTVEYKIVKIV